MTADKELNPLDGQPDAVTPVASLKTHGSGASACSQGNCVCKQRLHDSIADVPPRRHELDVLRMYMGKLSE